MDGIGAASPMELSRIGNLGGLGRSPANGSAVHGGATSSVREGWR